MPNHTLIRPRMPLALLAAVTALAVSSAPAFAGSDGSPCADGAAVAHTSGESDCPPAPPAPAPVAPAPVPVAPAPAPVKAPSKPAKKKTTTKKSPTQPKVAAVQTRPVVPQQTFVQTETVEQATVPSGGVQAGAGGTAPQAPGQLPVALLVPGLLLTLLALGGGLRLAQVRSRR